MFLVTRLYCSFVMEYDIHTILDLATLGTTIWVIYMIRFILNSSYMDDKDNFAHYYVVHPLPFPIVNCFIVHILSGVITIVDTLHQIMLRLT